VLKVALGLSFALGTIALVFPPKAPSSEEEALGLGLLAIEEGRLGDAESYFKAAAGSESLKVASAAYHNLALLSLQEALSSEDPRVHPATGDAVRLSESSIVLVPGAEETAWNLELALRLLRSHGTRNSQPAEQNQGQQEEEPSADTRNEGNHDREDSQAGESPQRGELSEEAARRLLASFRLMERNQSGEALKALLRVEPGVASFRRRGPPW
jgi:hypothetical protein